MALRKLFSDVLVTLDGGIPLLVVSDRITMRKCIVLIIDFRRDRYEVLCNRCWRSVGS
jgi:hypothetical protein